MCDKLCHAGDVTSIQLHAWFQPPPPGQLAPHSPLVCPRVPDGASEEVGLPFWTNQVDRMGYGHFFPARQVPPPCSPSWPHGNFSPLLLTAGRSQLLVKCQLSGVIWLLPLAYICLDLPESTRNKKRGGRKMGNLIFNVTNQTAAPGWLQVEVG